MNAATPKVLSHADIQKLSSPYLSEGRKQECWQIDSVSIDGPRLSAKVSMHSSYISTTDGSGFHLSIFSTLEFLSQLMLIYAHVWAGLSVKTREGWMVESRTRSVSAIRNPDHIQVEMVASNMRQRGANLYCVADYKVTDDQGGLFEVKLKGFLS